jgi:hypothetical protein
MELSARADGCPAVSIEPESPHIAGVNAMSYRTVGAVALICLTVTAAIVYAQWRAAGLEEMQTITDRVAAAAARSDRDALAAEPILQTRAGTVDFILTHGPILANGYRVTVTRNGADGYRLMPAVVTHVGHVETAQATLHLGFRYDRGSGTTELVTASFSTSPHP